MTQDYNISDSDIAIVGMSSRLPGSKNTDEFWRNLCAGIESITTFSEEQLRSSLANSLGYIPQGTLETWLQNPNFIKAGADLEGIDLFDAAFFGYTATEAKLLDPQQRLFLECSWEALEDAAYVPDSYNGLIGIYAGEEMSSYHHNLHAAILPSERDLLAIIGNATDYLTTRVAYKLNLKGPSFSVQSACSTSLIAIHVACQSLKYGECDMALAGGVVAYATQQAGYLYEKGSMFSPDGHCRPFDAQAQGTVFANGGVGVVVLKRLADAIADRDNLYAVIKGSAINNDGAAKTGYTAPGINGQVRVILEAMAVAGVDPESISYIEAHGTGTPLGDPIEITALTQGFRRSTQKNGFCAIGSLKSNMGHLGAAAGVAGLMKTALALKYKTLPPSLNYESPNPEIDFAHSPFYVNKKLNVWKTDRHPRRAGISAFGMGGSNAHMILEEPVQRDTVSTSRPWQLLLFSARTPSALEASTSNFVEHLRRHPDIVLPDIAFTLQVGRKAFTHRCALVCRTLDEAKQSIESGVAAAATASSTPSPIIFMFSGQGSQYLNMAGELYREEPTFREQIDRCAELLKIHLSCDIRDILYPSEQHEQARQLLNQTYVTQPALFMVEYALAKLWMKWGLQPQALIGHSIGEYTAACLAGVFSLEDALAIVATRGKLMQELPRGAMLSISLPESEVERYLNADISLAAHNGTTSCVISGPIGAIEQVEQQLAENEVPCRRLKTSHAFHSAMMDPILHLFAAQLQKITYHSPQIPYLSNLTGTWITEKEATDPSYWVRHLRQTVRFFEGIQTLQGDAQAIFLEVGPGRSLTTFVKQHIGKNSTQMILSSLPHPQDTKTDMAFLLQTCGLLWCRGVDFDWSAFYATEQRQRISLPTYPFEHKRYWVFPHQQNYALTPPGSPGKKTHIADWFTIPSWKQSMLPPLTLSAKRPEDQPCWLVFIDTSEFGLHLIKGLEQDGALVILVLVGEQFNQVSDRKYVLSPGQKADYVALVEDLRRRNRLPTHIAHLWSIIPIDEETRDIEIYESTQLLGFHSLVLLLQTLGIEKYETPLSMTILSNNLCEVIGGEVHHPARATIWGAGMVIPYEYPHIVHRTIDVVIPDTLAEQKKLVKLVLGELQSSSTDTIVAYRGSRRWVHLLEPVHLDKVEENQLPLRETGVYLITGGLGGIGITLAKYLAETVHAKLVLLGRTTLPEKVEWEQWLTTHTNQNAISNKILQIQALEKLGAQVLVLQADVSDLIQMRTVLTEVYKHFGALHGVIHSAGLPASGLLQLKSIDAAEQVFAPKVKGTLVLETILQNIHLDFLVLCSSLYSVIGGLGQSDYCGANAFLDSFAFYNTSHGTRTISINWDAWQEVGMAAKIMGGDHQKHLLQRDTTQIKECNHPLLDTYTIEEPNEVIYMTNFSAATHWVLDEHRIQGVCVLSATTQLEMIRSAFETYMQQAQMEIHDVFFFTPLKIEEHETKEVCIQFKNGENDHTFRVLSRTKLAAANHDSTAWLLHSEGSVRRLREEASPSYDLASLWKRIHMSDFDDSTQPDREAFMQFGPRWNSLQQIGWNGHEGLATVSLAQHFTADLKKMLLHPALLDIATGFTARYQISAPDIAYLPFFYKKLFIYHPLPSKCISYSRFKADTLWQETLPDILVYDVTIMDEQGTILVEIEDFSLKKVLGSQMKHSTLTYVSARTTEHGSPSSFTQKKTATYENQEGLTGGIEPGAGIEAFRRILSSVSVPQVIVSARDIEAARQHTPELSLANEPRNNEQSIQHVRRDLDVAYLAPLTKMEELIVDVWQKVLGIEKIGIHDNFFEIGGDSVMIIQIIKRLQTAFQIDLSMHMFFATPTIAGIADTITRKQMELIDDHQMAELLQQVSQMSEEDIMTQLGKKSSEGETKK